jgi:hypothetical protein
MCIGLQVKSPYYCPILIKIDFSGQIFDKYSDFKMSRIAVYLEPSCSIRTDRRDEANIGFNNFENAPKKSDFARDCGAGVLSGRD